MQDLGVSPPWDPQQIRALIASLNAERYPAQAPSDVTAQAKAQNPWIDDKHLRPMYLAPGVLGGFQHGLNSQQSIGVHDAAFRNPQGSDWARAFAAMLGSY